MEGKEEERKGRPCRHGSGFLLSLISPVKSLFGLLAISSINSFLFSLRTLFPGTLTKMMSGGGHQGDGDGSAAQPTSPNPAVAALEAKIMAYQNINEGGTKGRNTNLQKLEVLWDLEEVVSAAAAQGGHKEADMASSSRSSRKRTQEGPASAQLAKLAELLLASLTHPVGPGPPIRRLLAASLALLHTRVATRQLFTLVDALHATLTTKNHPLLAKLYEALLPLLPAALCSLWREALIQCI